MSITLRTIYLVTTVLLCNTRASLEHEIPRRSFLSRRAIDGTRGRKYFDPEDEGSFDSYGSAGGQYDPYEERTDLYDIRRNVPGEPGIDYPAYTTLPQTGFTCDGRARGYYADEAAGCQVFHVCHDVLVSSFLCPIGSIFSQKLLTCDWWTKVDCSSSRKFIEVNRDNYQVDDDEMIRNAYAMIGLQTGKDLTKDVLVDPDRGGRILDYVSVEASRNDVPNDYDRFLAGFTDYRYRQKQKTTPIYRQNEYYSQDYETRGPPYRDSPIIRIQKIESPRVTYQHDYRDAYQPSYAPTVPTVTTTTRRFYSPTVPTTTFRPSTAPYKFDQIVDSSDHLYSHSHDGFVTPPTFSHRENKNQSDEKIKTVAYEDDEVEYYDDLVERKVEDKFLNGTGGHEGSSSSEFVKEGSSRHPEVFRLDRNIENQRVGEDIYEDDIETKDSIGLGHVLGGSSKNSASEQGAGASGEFEGKGTKVSGISTRTNTSGHSMGSEIDADFSDNRKLIDRYDAEIVRPTAAYENQEETTTIRSISSQNYSNEQFDKKIDSLETENSSIEIATEKPINNINSTLEENSEKNSSDKISTNKSSVDRTNERSNLDAEILNTPRTAFRINVPETKDSRISSLLTSYATENDPTTESPKLDDTFEYSTERNSGISTLPSLTPVWFNRQNIEQPATDFVPPIVDYNDGYEDFLAPEEKIEESQHFYAPLSSVKNDSEKEILSRYNTNFQFTIRDAIENFPSTRSDSSHDSPDRGFVSTTSESSRTIFEENFVATTAEPYLETESGSTLDPGFEYNSSTTEKNFNINFPGSSSTSLFQTTTPQSIIVPSVRSSDERQSIDTSTASTLFQSISPETLKEIEETIDQNNSPYQVSLTLNKDEELISSTGDIIGRLIAQQGRKNSSESENIDNLELIRSTGIQIPSTSTAPPIVTTIPSVQHPSTTHYSKSDLKPYHLSFNTEPEETRESVELPDAGTVSLLQLMAELLKVDRLPRPFSVQELENVQLRSKTHQVEKIEDRKNDNSQESLTILASDRPRPLFKEQIRDRLTDNFGQPLYRVDSMFSLPQVQRSLDFETGLPLGNTRSYVIDRSEKIKNSFDTTTPSATTITTTITPVTTTESTKTIVETEFVPSIGFSFDTDEGREEYVEAVLRGLINESTTASPKIESSTEKNSQNSTLQNDTLINPKTETN